MTEMLQTLQEVLQQTTQSTATGVLSLHVVLARCCRCSCPHVTTGHWHGAQLIPETGSDCLLCLHPHGTCCQVAPMAEDRTVVKGVAREAIQIGSREQNIGRIEIVFEKALRRQKAARKVQSSDAIEFVEVTV